jgi:hypothetical protein
VATRLGALGLVAVASAVATASACREEGPPAALADGTPARIASDTFEGVTVPVVVTRVRTALVSEHECVRRHARTRSRVVERVSVAGRSATVLSAHGFVYGCDGTSEGPACGHAFAQPRLQTDPRLSLTCRDANGRPVGFAWIVPGAGAAFIVVEHGTYGEAYRVVGDVPVRVTTEDVDLPAAQTRFAISEHARDGSLLRYRELEAQVSG